MPWRRDIPLRIDHGWSRGEAFVTEGETELLFDSGDETALKQALSRGSNRFAVLCSPLALLPMLETAARCVAGHPHPERSARCSSRGCPGVVPGAHPQAHMRMLAIEVIVKQIEDLGQAPPGGSG